MDNDLMARRLRPPSEPSQPQQPTQPIYPPAPDQQFDQQFDQQLDQPSNQPLPQWPPAPPAPMAPDQPISMEPTSLESTPDPAAEPIAVPWTPEAREEVPWDRPDDYDQSTDTASNNEQAAWDKPVDETWADPNPAWPPAAIVAANGAALASQPAASVDPDDAYAPVLGDVATPMARAWPETNGRDADRNASTIGQTDKVESATPVESATVAQPDADPPLTSWPVPAQSVAVPPEDGPAEWASTAQPTDYAEHHVGQTPPHDLFAANGASAPFPHAEPRPTQHDQPDGEAWLSDPAAWPTEPPAPDVSPAVKPQPNATNEPTPAAELTPEPAPAAAIQAAVVFPASDTPVVMRIELTIVDGKLGIVDAADSARNVTPRDLDFDPRGGTGNHEDKAAEPEPPALAAPHAPLSSDVSETWSRQVEPNAIPPATVAAPWAGAAFAPAAPPMLQKFFESPTTPPPAPVAPAPVDYTPWAQSPPVTDPLAAIPAQAFVTQPAPQPVQPVHQPQPEYQMPAPAPVPAFAPPVQQQPIATAAATVVAVPLAPALAPAPAKDQNDLWFLSTEPDDVDAAPDDDDQVAPKEPSSVLTVVLTIGMAVLVIVLVLVFFNLMTSLLG